MVVRVLILTALLPLGLAPALGDEKRKAHEVAAEVDERLAEAWAAAKVKPARRSGDAEFLRRVSLDLQGVVPPPELVSAFLDQKGKDRRPLVVRGLLFGQGYARGMAGRWANELIGRPAVIQSGGDRSPLVLWLAQQFAANTPWDVTVRELLTVTGPVDQSGATVYFLRYNRRPEELAGNVMRVFQGLSVQCAQCHDHPFSDEISQRDFWGVAAFFARVQQQNDGEIRSIVEQPQGQVRLPAPPGQPRPVIAPQFLHGPALATGPGQHRRDDLARFLTAPDNPYFAQNTVNRVWSFFFGQGFADLDDLLLSEVRAPAVLELLADDFQASGYDMRRLCLVITSTQAYQLSSTGKSDDAQDQLELFARASLRALTPEQLWASLVEVVGLNQVSWGDTPEQAANYREQLRRGFFSVFAPEGQRTLDQNTIPQALALMNGVLANQLLAPNRNPIVASLLELRGDSLINALYLRTLGRPATRGEVRALSREGKASGEQLVFIQDMLWALVNSSEFSFNH